jgi:hypothetical protein
MLVSLSLFAKFTAVLVYLLAIGLKTKLKINFIKEHCSNSLKLLWGYSDCKSD